MSIKFVSQLFFRVRDSIVRSLDKTQLLQINFTETPISQVSFVCSTGAGLIVVQLLFDFGSAICANS